MLTYAKILVLSVFVSNSIIASDQLQQHVQYYESKRIELLSQRERLGLLFNENVSPEKWDRLNKAYDVIDYAGGFCFTMVVTHQEMQELKEVLNKNLSEKDRRFFTDQLTLLQNSFTELHEKSGELELDDLANFDIEYFIENGNQ